jgi:hypothetical protein
MSAAICDFDPRFVKPGIERGPRGCNVCHPTGFVQSLRSAASGRVTRLGFTSIIPEFLCSRPQSAYQRLCGMTDAPSLSGVVFVMRSLPDLGQRVAQRRVGDVHQA